MDALRHTDVPVPKAFTWRSLDFDALMPWTFTPAKN